MKYKRVAGEDEDLENGIKYTFVEDNHAFKVEGATLRYVINMLQKLYTLLVALAPKDQKDVLSVHPFIRQLNVCRDV